MVEGENGLVTGIEFQKSDCPISLAFRFEETPNEISRATISGQDHFVAEVRDHLDRAFSYLQCYFSTALETQSISITHEAENDEEEEQIVLGSFKIGEQKGQPLSITFDYITRSIMAAEEANAPHHESSLVQLARENLARGRFIDSFRYSFLLLESIYGNGQSQKWALVDALDSHVRFREIVQNALSAWQPPKDGQHSATDDLLSGCPSIRDVITHLVERRGHYFHANKRKPKSWNAKSQSEAMTLAWLGVWIAQAIAQDAANPIFSPEFEKRHFDDAGKMGAHVTMKVEYFYRTPEYEFIRKRELNAKLPGTKITTQMAMHLLQNALIHFEQEEPVGTIHSMVGKADDGSEVFSVRFQTERDGTIVGS